MQKQFTTIWKNYEPMMKAIVELFHPFVEVAVHDLEQGTLVALYNNISRRKIGQPSPLKELHITSEKFPPYFAPYYKQNWDGRPLKCTSITLRNSKGKAIGLICINADVSLLHETQRVIETFLRIKDTSENPVEIFGGQAKSHIDALIEEYIHENKLSLAHLDREGKKRLVHHLYQKGSFNFKNAAPLIAKKLGSSRASIYNYIKQLD